MGAGTNVQDKLIALHDLDCPWRPRDLTQRKGRIERRGNDNKNVHVYRYVTEGTFDAYLWQTVENKQKFISQIMTSKSPARTCEDVDEAALSYAEIKALCAGDPRIKERMELDVDVSKLKIMKSAHQSQQFQMEDNLLKYFPEQIAQHQGFIKGLEADMKTLAEHPHPRVVKEKRKPVKAEASSTPPAQAETEGPAATEISQGFAGMVVQGDTFTDKEEAGKALLAAYMAGDVAELVEIGSYRGFTMFTEVRCFQRELVLKGAMTHRTPLGLDPAGALVRVDHTLDKMSERLVAVRTQLENLFDQREAARAEVGKPLKAADIKAEAEHILKRIQGAQEPNSPNGTHYMAQVSPDFLARAKTRDTDRLMSMLPFQSLSLSGLEGRGGVYALISRDENRFQKLVLRKSSVKKKLQEKAEETSAGPAPGKSKSKDQER